MGGGDIKLLFVNKSKLSCNPWLICILGFNILTFALRYYPVTHLQNPNCARCHDISIFWDFYSDVSNQKKCWRPMMDVLEITHGVGNVQKFSSTPSRWNQFSSGAKNRQDTINKHFNYWGILCHIHLHDIDHHVWILNSVALLTQLVLIVGRIFLNAGIATLLMKLSDTIRIMLEYATRMLLSTKLVKFEMCSGNFKSCNLLNIHAVTFVTISSIILRFVDTVILKKMQ